MRVIVAWAGFWGRRWIESIVRHPEWSGFSGRASNIVLVEMTGGIHVSYFGSSDSRGELNSYGRVMKIMGSNGSVDLMDDTTLLAYGYDGRPVTSKIT